MVKIKELTLEVPATPLQHFTSLVLARLCKRKKEFQKLSVELIYKTDCKVFGVFFFFKKLKSNPVPSWLPPLGVLNFAAFYVCFSFVPLIF